MRGRSASHFYRVQRFVQLGLKPLLKRLIAVQFAELALDQFSLTLIYMTIGFCSGDQCTQDSLAVLLGFSLGQAINGLRLTLTDEALTGLPVVIGLIGQYAQCRQASVSQYLTAHTARAFAAQKAHGTCSQRTATGAGQQTAKTALRGPLAFTAAEQTAQTIDQ